MADAAKEALEALGENIQEEADSVEDEGAPAIQAVDDDSIAEINEEVDAGNEQRQHRRYRVSLKVFIRLSNGDVTQAQAVDLSMGGIYIEYGAAADKDKVFEMAFDLPFKDDFKRVFVKAKVVRAVVIGSRNMYGLAFIFTEFAKGTDQVLAKYMELRGRQA